MAGLRSRQPRKNFELGLIRSIIKIWGIDFALIWALERRVRSFGYQVWAGRGALGDVPPRPTTKC